MVENTVKVKIMTIRHFEVLFIAVVTLVILCIQLIMSGGMN